MTDPIDSYEAAPRNARLAKQERQTLEYEKSRSGRKSADFDQIGLLFNSPPESNRSATYLVIR